MNQPQPQEDFSNNLQTKNKTNQEQDQKLIDNERIKLLQEDTHFQQNINNVHTNIKSNNSKTKTQDTYEIQKKANNQKIEQEKSENCKEIYQEDLSSDQQKSNNYQFQIFKKTLATHQNINQKQKQLKSQIIQQKLNTNQLKSDKLQQTSKIIQKQIKESKQAKKQKQTQKQKQKQAKRQMRSSINPNQTVQSRKIPDKLLQSYEEIVLPKTQAKKSQKKQKGKNIKPTNSNQQQNKNKISIEEQMLTSLPTIQGFCSIKFENKNPLQIKYLIIKQTIIFPQLKKINIQTIKKIKILQKNDQYFIKICLQKGSKQDEVFLLTIFANQNAKFAVFYRTFLFFSSIVLRKIILKSILINQHIQKFQKDSPLEYESNLFKKDHFFSSWQKRKVRLQKNIMSTYKGDKCSNQIKSIRQLWTRFDMMNGYLIVKMWHGYQKIQLGIPLCDFTIIDAKMNWLYGLIRLIKQKQEEN